jgi:hypothetical protein
VQRAAVALIEDAIPGDPRLAETWPVYASLLLHAQAVLTDDSDGMAWIANYLGSSGSYTVARDLLERALEAREQALGSEHPHTLTARHELARWTGAVGDAAGPATSSPRCCPSRSGSRALSTPPPWPPAATSPTGHGRLTVTRILARTSFAIFTASSLVT